MDDLINEFITETIESLELLDQELVRLEQDPENTDILGNIFRVMHTVKGTSGFLGLPRLSTVAHAAESLLSLMREGTLKASSDAVTLILASADRIKEIVDHLGQSGTEPEGSDEALIHRLEAFILAPTQKAAAPPAQAAPGTPDEEGEGYTIFFAGDADLAALIAAENQAATPTEEPSDFGGFFAGDAELAALIEAEKQQQAAAAPPPPAAPAAPPAPVEAKPAEAKPTEEKSGSGGIPSIRVNIDVLENLMQMVSELVLNRNQLLQIVRTHPDVQERMQAPVQQMSYITSELQEGIMKTRMQPIGSAWAKFPRLIRDLSGELGKKIELRMRGEETELDRQLLELVKDPLTHMVRNSCDHGLELPMERLTAGKPEAGTVTLAAFHEGGHIIIQITDDGRGLSLERIRQKALTNGVVTPSALEMLSPQQIMQFIFAPGFSTAEKVTSVSGRGVGMDVVRTNIEKMGGTIEISSEEGKGSTFTIKIPLTLAIVSVLIVESKGLRFAIPQLNVLELVTTAPGSEYAIETIHGTPVLRLREKLLPLGSLSEILGLEAEGADWSATRADIVICNVGGFDFGLIVDRVYDTEEIVVKPVTERLKNLQLYSGNTILGDGSVIMILDPAGLARNITTLQNDMAASKATEGSANASEDAGVSFLLFRTNKGAPKAVPLELIARLEEIEVKNIELVGTDPVVQYRGDLMRLVTLGDFYLPSPDTVNVIVFSYDRRNIGLIVDSIIDIVDAPYDIKLGTTHDSCLGSMIIAEKTTDIVDVAKLLSDLVEKAVGAQGIAQRRSTEPCHLLLVEDSPFFRNIAEPFLAAAGYHVLCAENGGEALELLRRKPNHFDAIVTDIEMPVMNGFDFALACRADPALQHLPIVAYTASLSQVTAQRCGEVGINACIVKTDRPGLLEALSEQLSRQEEAA